MAARARIRLTLTVIATAALAGACDLLAPTPDRFVSDAAWALRIDTLPIHGLQPGQHIARRVTITPDFGGIADRVFAVLLQVDTTIVVQGVVSPWRLEFDARLWPSGLFGGGRAAGGNGAGGLAGDPLGVSMGAALVGGDHPFAADRHAHLDAASSRHCCGG